jgi:trehalose 6-phosphate synthase/phosphatase
MPGSRVVIVSNRLPVTAKVDDTGATTLERSSGGLATALRSVTSTRESGWVGWTGIPDAPAQRASIEQALANTSLRAVHLSAEEVGAFYDGFSNAVLWPLFHYLIDKLDLEDVQTFKAYEAVNQRFAQAAVAEAGEDDIIWVHDYQLLLVPQMIRALRPRARIGFFLHIPFPSEEVFRILPWRAELLRGMLGADVVGLHTDRDANHFTAACAQLLGITPEPDALFFEGRTIRVGAYPISIDTAAIAEHVRTPAIEARVEQVRASAPGRTILLGIDRLDYTKGIRARLLAFERLLARRPELCEHVQLVQVAVPSRSTVPAYADFQQHVHSIVGRVNGKYGTVSHTPIVFLHRSLDFDEVVSFYAAADVMLVTPLRDGMNLVAKEYVASRRDDDGVLVLSEFAGAAAELSEAVLVNPYDLDGTSLAFERALEMGASEKRLRMRALRRRVASHDVKRWCDSFLADLVEQRPVTPAPSPSRRILTPPPGTVSSLVASDALCLLLDYDGTLVSHASVPELAAPDEELLRLLDALVARPMTRVHVVSSRRREDLEQWFGQLNLGLHAEYGFWSKDDPTHAWQTTLPVSEGWKPPVLRVLERATARTVGSFIEEKDATIAWHYRNAEPELAAARLRDLKTRLAPIALEHRLDVVDAVKAFEVRIAGLAKSVAVAEIVGKLAPDTTIVAIGDDRSDEDMFRALPESATTIHVGPEALDVGLVSTADFRVAGPRAVRELLAAMVR